MGQDASAEQTDVRLSEYRGWFDFPAVVNDEVVVFIQIIGKIGVDTADRIGFSVFFRTYYHIQSGLISATDARNIPPVADGG
ncbi:hypothetical protein DSOL_3756 [Desulfosporosinus metallidurans]|uniref:Uncharacterized protein n=1 Tax=Desulfosporosinus metallidurans TaxID=1888891 RepID=A0A1Q8QNM4_9FIRM|nr:hypothetical protein DSOL_3756 [Desulfosporosinus metallidurans]